MANNGQHQNISVLRSNDVGRSNLALLLFTITGGVGAAITIISLPFISPAFRKVCLPYVPATTQQVENVLKALKGRSGSLIDLGSGDGRIVFATAKMGFKAHGIELNPWLVWYSKLTALANGLSSSTTFLRQNLWKYNLKHYNNVIVFGVEEMMQDMERKCVNELQKDCLIVTCRFPLPTLKASATIGYGTDTVWIYKMCRH